MRMARTNDMIVKLMATAKFHRGQGQIGSGLRFWMIAWFGRGKLQHDSQHCEERDLLVPSVSLSTRGA